MATTSLPVDRLMATDCNAAARANTSICWVLCHKGVSWVTHKVFQEFFKVKDVFDDVPRKCFKGRSRTFQICFKGDFKDFSRVL